MLPAGETPCVLTRTPSRSWLCPVVWIFSLLVIFGAGAVSGAAGYAYWYHAHLLWCRENPKEIPELVMKKLTASLGLTAEQIPKVEDVVRRRHQRFDELQAEIHPEMDAECAGYEQEMQAILTPAQYERWLPHFREVRKIWLP